MKRFSLIVMSSLALLLSACGTPPSRPVVEDPTLEPEDTSVFPDFEIVLGGRKPYNWQDYPDTSWIYIKAPESLMIPRPIIKLNH